MNDVLLRRLRPADAALHRALMLEAYGSCPEAFTSTRGEREALPLDWWAARLSDAPEPPVLVCGAFDGTGLVGAAGLSFEERERTRHKATLVGLYVRAAARGRGIGRQLVEAVLHEARASGRVELVQLTVSAPNREALALYGRCGFVVFGTEPMAVRLGERFIDKLHLWRRVG